MKMVLIVCPEDREEDVREVISQHDVHAYTELGRVTGEGAHGRRLGDWMFPETSTMIFTVVPSAKATELQGALQQLAARSVDGLHAFVLPVEAAF